MDGMGKRIMVVDGHSLAYRAFFALPGDLSSQAGIPTNAIYGFLRMLLAAMNQEKPEGVMVAFDKAAPTFRHEEFEGYKAHRKPMPDDLRVQVPIIKQILAAMGIPVLEMEGYEADDILGTVARQAEEQGYDAILLTGDRDSLQLVSDRVRVMLTKKGITDLDVLDRPKVIERFGFGPELVPDFKGLMGDPSDNIPGVPGIGEKTAQKLVAEWGTVENILDNIDSVSPQRVREAIMGHREQALMSKRLATIDTNAPVTVDLDACCRPEADQDKLSELLSGLGMKSIIKQLGIGREAAQPSPDPGQGPGHGQGRELDLKLGGKPGGEPCTGARRLSVTIVGDQTGLEEAVREISTAPRFALEVVLAPGRTMQADILAIHAALEDGRCFHIPVALGSAVVLEAFKPLLEDESRKKLCHDAKTKIEVLKLRGVDLRGVEFDSAIAAYLADPAAKNDEIPDVATKWLGRDLMRLDDAVRKAGDTGRGRPHVALETVTKEPVANAVASMLLSLFDLRDTLLARIEVDGMTELYEDVEMPLTRVLAEMEMAGVKVDPAALRELSRSMESRIEALTKEIYELAGEPFNINSTKQLGTLLFEKLGLPALKKTKTGYSTDAEVLEELADRHEIVGKILDYRALVKLKSTYADALGSLINPNTGRIHTTFNQTVTATGRLSSADPNLQNIPVRTPEGRKIREVFVPGEPGWLILSADYSQIELRVLAHISGDEVLRDSFIKDQDIHARTASEVFGVRLEDVTPEMRSRAKAVNFGIVYGISDFGLARNIKVSRREAKAFIDAYFDRYRGVKRYMEEIVQDARVKGYVTTLLNRRRYLPDLRSRNVTVRKFAERTAMNTPIQGTAADIIKLAMVQVHRRLRESGLRARMLLQVHDELVFEVPEGEVEQLTRLATDTMEHVMDLSVPLKVEAKAGPNWMQAK